MPIGMPSVGLIVPLHTTPLGCAVDEHRVAVAREVRARRIVKPTSFFVTPFSFCFDERVACRRTRPSCSFTSQREVRLERRDGVVDVVAVERHPHLEAQRVARAESGGRDVAGRP